MTNAQTQSFTANLGNAALAHLGHALWSFAKLVFRHPFNATGIAILVWGIGLGGINALWLQHHRHPAPLFMQQAALAEPADTPVPARNGSARTATPQPLPAAIEPVMPATRHEAAVPVSRAPAPIIVPDVGNPDVAALQAKLKAMGLFPGNIDGYYGPATAKSIRAFEQQAGLSVNGALTKEIEQAVKNAPVQIAAPARVAAAPSSAVVNPAPVHSQKLDPIGQIALSASKRAQAAPAAPKAQTVASVAPQQAPKAATAQASPELVSMVQTGLARLGFYAAPVTGKFDQTTARAIREFETYNNYPVTGKMQPDLIDLLMNAGAYN